jgi:hypothetical protein
MAVIRGFGWGVGGGALGGETKENHDPETDVGALVLQGNARPGGRGVKKGWP